MGDKDAVVLRVALGSWNFQTYHQGRFYVGSLGQGRQFPPNLSLALKYFG